MDKLKKLSGIKENGYGPIYWFVMGDYTLSLAARTVYAYICSYLSSDGNDTCFPSIDTVTTDLKMGRDLLYKSFNELIKKDLLIILNRSYFKNGKHHFTSNEYRLNLTPKHFDFQKVKKAITEGNIGDLGTGSIPRKVMTDRSIDHEAKGLFAYYAARAGSIQEYRIDEEETRRILHLSEKRWRKYRNQLVGKYIEVSYKKSNGIYPAGYVIRILSDGVDNQEESEIVHNFCSECKTTQKKETENVDNYDLNGKTTQKKETQKKETQKKEGQNKARNNNGYPFNTNSSHIISNSKVNHHGMNNEPIPDEIKKKIGLDRYLQYLNLIKSSGLITENDAAPKVLKAYLIAQALYAVYKECPEYQTVILEGSLLSEICDRSKERYISNPINYVLAVLKNMSEEVRKE